MRYRARLFPQEGLSPLALLTGLGYVPGTLSVGVGEHLYLEETRDTGYRLLDPRGLSGATTLFLVGYDANNNRVELRLPLWLPGRAGQGGPGGPRPWPTPFPGGWRPWGFKEGIAFW